MGIQMKQKERSKTLLEIYDDFKLKKPLFLLFNPFSTGTVFRRQILTSNCKEGSRTEIIKIFIVGEDP